MIVAATKAARDLDKLVTIGIPPTHPNTGYGYIEIQPAAKEPFNVKAFHEKPDRATAKRYLESGWFFWNSGMFAWPVAKILSQLKAHLPKTYDGLKKPAEGMMITCQRSLCCIKSLLVIGSSALLVMVFHRPGAGPPF